MNVQLKDKLDSIGREDQRYRKLITDRSDAETDSLVHLFGVQKNELSNYLIGLQNNIDKGTLDNVEGIISQYGYPGRSLVGEPTNLVAFYVIQHSDKISRYLSSVKRAALKNEIPFTEYAMMKDRYLVQSGKVQIYGSQLWGLPVKDSIGNVSIAWYFSPIKRPKAINKRRRRAGFDQSIEEYAGEFNIPFRIKEQYPRSRD